jgi:two-component system sensor histidine kinase KdpD
MADPAEIKSMEPSFAELVQTRERGKLKVYIGSAAGTGKTYRMLNEAHLLRDRGVDVVVGFVETGRAETGPIRDLSDPRRSVPRRHPGGDDPGRSSRAARRSPSSMSWPIRLCLAPAG